MRGLLFSRNHADFNLSEAAFFQELMQLHFAKAEPVVRVEFTSLFEAVTQQVENNQTTAALQNPMTFIDGALRVNGVMQCLAQNSKIDTVFRNRRGFHISQAAFEGFVGRVFCPVRSRFYTLWRIFSRGDPELL